MRFTSARHVLSYIITTTRAQIKIKYFFIPDSLAVRLLSYSLTFSFCKIQLSIYKFISKHMRNYARCYDLIC